MQENVFACIIRLQAYSSASPLNATCICALPFHSQPTTTLSRQSAAGLRSTIKIPVTQEESTNPQALLVPETLVHGLQPGLSNPAGAPERYYYFTVPDQTIATINTWFVLPADVTCARCVLQWRWVTGNSCFGAPAIHSAICPVTSPISAPGSDGAPSGIYTPFSVGDPMSVMQSGL